MRHFDTPSDIFCKLVNILFIHMFIHKYLLQKIIPANRAFSFFFYTFAVKIVFNGRKYRIKVLVKENQRFRNLKT